MMDRFFGCQRTGLDQCLRQRVIGCQLLKRSATKQVDPTVSDATHVHDSGNRDDKRNRRSHVFEFGIELAQSHDFVIGLSDRVIDNLGCLFRRGLFEVDQLKLSRDNIDGQSTGTFPSGLTTHPVRHEEKSISRVDIASVFVVFTLSNNAQPSDPQFHNIPPERR